MPGCARLDIAITDKNPHVREFLARELGGMGHGVRVLSGSCELLEALGGPRPPQVLVLDPEAAGAHLGELARRLKSLSGRVTVVLHLFEDAEPQAGFDGALVVEKEPDMRALKQTLNALASQVAALAGDAGAGGRPGREERT